MERQSCVWKSAQKIRNNWKSLNMVCTVKIKRLKSNQSLRDDQSRHVGVNFEILPHKRLFMHGLTDDRYSVFVVHAAK